MTFASVLRPNYRRARELKSEIEDLEYDLADLNERGKFHEAAETLDVLNEAKAELFRSGVTSEYEL